AVLLCATALAAGDRDLPKASEIAPPMTMAQATEDPGMQDPGMQDRQDAGAGTVEPGRGTTGQQQMDDEMDRQTTGMESETGLAEQTLPATATPGWMQSLAAGTLLLIGAAGVRVARGRTGRVVHRRRRR